MLEIRVSHFFCIPLEVGLKILAKVGIIVSLFNFYLLQADNFLTKICKMIFIFFIKLFQF